MSTIKPPCFGVFFNLYNIFLQVVPIPRELIPEVPPPIMQVMPTPPPPPPMYESYGQVSIVHAMPGPPPELMVPGQGMVPVIGPMPTGPMGSVMSPPIQLHYSQMIPAEQVILNIPNYYYIKRRLLRTKF